MTEMTPIAPLAIMENVRASSPLMTSKWRGLFFNISSTCSRLPEASLMPTMFGNSVAKRTVVVAFMLTPVRPGTLYITIGNGAFCAMALKCWYKPSCDGLL